MILRQRGDLVDPSKPCLRKLPSGFEHVTSEELADKDNHDCHGIQGQAASGAKGHQQLRDTELGQHAAIRHRGHFNGGAVSSGT